MKSQTMLAAMTVYVTVSPMSAEIQVGAPCLANMPSARQTYRHLGSGHDITALLSRLKTVQRFEHTRHYHEHTGIDLTPSKCTLIYPMVALNHRYACVDDLITPYDSINLS